MNEGKDQNSRHLCLAFIVYHGTSCAKSVSIHSIFSYKLWKCANKNAENAIKFVLRKFKEFHFIIYQCFYWNNNLSFTTDATECVGLQMLSEVLLWS